MPCLAEKSVTPEMVDSFNASLEKSVKMVSINC